MSNYIQKSKFFLHAVQIADLQFGSSGSKRKDCLGVTKLC